MQKVVALLLLAFLAACTTAPVGKSKKAKPAGDEDDSTSASTDGRGDDDEDSASPGPGPGAALEPDPVVDTTALDPFFKTQMETGKIPGVGIAVVRAGKLKWTKGYGLADVAANKPVGRDTLFMLASVSKTVTGVALMQLMEDKARGLSLDQDISTKIGFTVRSPRFKDTPITYRMILTHTSSLIDGDAYFDTPHAVGDSPTSLESFAKSAIADPARWKTNKPGTVHEYSNTAIALVGLLVEKIAGTNLQEYAKGHIFEPLAMKETSFFLEGLDPSHIALPYDGVGLAPQRHYGYPDYPSGQIRTSAPQLARFLMMVSSGGSFAGQQVLGEATMADMIRPQLPAIEGTQGLVFFRDTKGGKAVFGHDGADKGVTTEMFFNPATRAGYVLLTNARDQLANVAVADAALGRMSDKLMELAETLP